MRTKHSSVFPVFISRHPRKGFAPTLLCLLAIVLQMVLPVVHIVYEHSVELSYELTSSVFGSGADDVRLVSNGTSQQHHHDPSSCPICQAFSLASGFITPHASAGLLAPRSAPLDPSDHDGLYIPFFCFNFNPRSPPFSA